MEITFNDRGQFAQLAKRFRAAGAQGAALRKALTTAIQAELKTVVHQVQTNVRAVDTHVVGASRRSGVRGRGSRSRERFDTAAELRRQSKAAAKGKTTRARRSSNPTGLRERIAHATKSKVQYTGFRLGAKVYIETSMFPHNQAKLPRYLNRDSGWRHPVWGHRDRWVHQVGEPYFDKAVEQHYARVRKSVNSAVNQVMRTLQQ